MIENVDGTETIQKVNFEWLPWACSVCKKFGHLAMSCKHRQRWSKVWVQKRQDINTESTGVTGKEGHEAATSSNSQNVDQNKKECRECGNAECESRKQEG